MSEQIPEGATHYHEQDEEWAHHFIKVTNPQMDNEEVLVWCAIRPEWGYWTNITVWDEDNKDKYIRLNSQSELDDEDTKAEELCIKQKAMVDSINSKLEGE